MMIDKKNILYVISIVLICFFSIKTYGMVKVNLMNGSVISKLSEKEFEKYRTKADCRLIQQDTVQDLIYRSESELYELFSVDGEYLFNLGGSVYYISNSISDYSYILEKTRCYQTLYSFRFLSDRKIVELLDRDKILESVRGFCLRNLLEESDLQLDLIKREVSTLGDKSINYYEEYLRVIIYLKSEDSSQFQMINVGFGEEEYMFTLIDKKGKEYSPIDELNKLYERQKVCTYIVQ